LYAANKASLDVVGDSVIPFVIDGHNFEADVSVSNKVDEFLLGSDWLEKNGAKWDFADGTTVPWVITVLRCTACIGKAFVVALL